jgi:hypothetical protein
MKLITEITENIKYISEEKESGKKNLYIEGVFLQGNIPNKNQRKYPINILEREVKRYDEKYIQKGRALGELGHPDGPSINLDRVSHKIISLKREGDNFVGKAKIMDTPMGKIVQSLISDGVMVGVSSRGMGSLKASKDGINEVQDDFYLATAADIVADPSAPDAFVNGIMEGVEFYWQDGGYLCKETKSKIEKSSAAGRLNDTTKLAIFESFLNNLSKIKNYK